MSLTVRDSNLFKPILVDAIKAQFALKTPDLEKAGVMTVVDGLPTTNNGRKWGLGSTIEFPFFNSIGELEDVAEGQALTPRPVTSSLESATVIRSGVAGEVTDWASNAAGPNDPYDQLAEQFVEGANRRIDKGGIDAALTTPLVYDTLGAALSLDHVILASELWLDQLDDNDGIKLLVVHSRVRRSLRLLKTLDGIPLYMDAKIGADRRPITLPMFAGIPVKTSNRLTPTGNVYPSLLFKRGALGAWMNSDPAPEEDRDILAASNITALNMYHAEHLYRKLSYLTDGVLPGAVKILSTEA
jgi:hypothetical protein